MRVVAKGADDASRAQSLGATAGLVKPYFDNAALQDLAGAGRDGKYQPPVFGRRVGPWLGKRAEIRPPVGYLGKGVHAVARAARQPVKARILVLMPAAFARRCIRTAGRPGRP
jgi:hypothetical protein